MTNYYENLKNAINEGIDGKNEGLATGFERLDNYISLKKKMLISVIGSPGCLAKGTNVIMYNGTLKKVEDVKIGDLLMGTDSTPRKVLELKRGVEQMYIIKQNKGISYTVNENHILSLKRCKKETISKKVIPNQQDIPYNKRKRDIIKGEQKCEYLNISVKDFLNKSKSFQEKWKGYKTGIDFKERDVPFDPYFLGLWLGDGTSRKLQITTADFEILDYLKIFAEKQELILKKHGKDEIQYNLSSEKRKKGCNHLLSKFQDLNLLKNKHIPDIFLYNSYEKRMQLLAGLIDSDGCKEKGGYYITLKNEKLAKQVNYLIRSLGFYSSFNEKKATMKRKDGSIYECIVYTMCVFGKCIQNIPLKIKRKKITSNNCNKIVDSLNTGIKIIKSKIDNYYGFTLDGDHLFLLEDFTVTHNSGKSAFTNLAFLINPFEDNFKTNKVKLKIILFSMERSIVFSFGKWMCLKIFQEQGVDLDLGTLLGWYRNKKLTPDGFKYVEMYEDYFTNLQNTLEIYEGQRSPNDIFRIVKGYSEANGKEENISEFKKKYIPNDPNEHVIVIVDHIGLTKPIKEYPSKKQAIDRLVEHLQYFRDYLGYTCVAVSQLNRDLSNPLYKKMDSFEPHLDNIKETGNLGEASDIVLSLFDPIRYNTTDKNYGDVEVFRSPINGHKYFRSVSILKNSYGIDGASIGTVFMGQNGLFKELMKSSEFKNLTEDQKQAYLEKIFTNEYFLKC